VNAVDPDIAAGHYARKQLLCASRLIAWSHRRRLETGLRLARRIGPKRVLDLGCGDGTFLALLTKGTGAPARAVGAEVAANLVADCRRRLERPPHLTFVHTNELDRPEHRATYDLVLCMEVLEHVVELSDTIDQLVQLMAPGGALLVSVPVETGPAVLVKQSARRIAGWLRVGDYPGTAPYGWRQLLRAVRGGPGQHIRRPVYQGSDGRRFHDHKGFNWRVVHRALADRLGIDALHTSPIPGVPPSLASQVWLIAHKT